MSTVCAVSTALEQGALSVIRISGSKALSVAEKVFVPYGKKKISEMSGYTCAYGKAVDKNGNRVDDCVLTVFKAPNSYTGEDTAEISCHGGVFVTKKILRLLVENGAEPAERGEFTKRAFLNGKLSLTQAESVMDIISAGGELTLKSANSVREGALFKKIEALKNRLVKLLGELAAWVDYPEEDLPEVELDNMRATVSHCLETCDKLIESYDNGLVLKNGIPAAIIGKPNVGKSTLMNLLLGYDRAIVTDIAGTTRDVLEETVRLGDVTLKLCDTAGLRETHDVVEKIGVDLARKKLGESALVIAVFDGTACPDDKDKQLVEDIKSSCSKVIALVNKSDVSVDSGYAELLKDLPCMIEISAKNGEGREALAAEIGRLFSLGGDETIFVNERQKFCLERAAENFRLALDELDLGLTFDALTIRLEQSAAALSELTGERITESVVDEVFSKFCVGK